MAELARISALTLILSCTEDRPISPAHALRVAEAIPGAVFQPMPGVGHAVMLERTDLVNRALLTRVTRTSLAA